MKLEDKIALWVDSTLEEETTEEEHYDLDVTVRYAPSDIRTRLIITSRIILYTSGGFENIIVTAAMDHPDEEIIKAITSDAIDCLRDSSHGSASLREVEDILESIGDDEDDEEE